MSFHCLTENQSNYCLYENEQYYDLHRLLAYVASLKQSDINNSAKNYIAIFFSTGSAMYLAISCDFISICSI